MCQHPNPGQIKNFLENFPRMEARSICIIGTATPRYNCVAWSLGITDQNVWPVSNDSDVSLAQFDVFYGAWGFQIAGIDEIGPNFIAALGTSAQDIRHAARFYAGPRTGGRTWTSKVGWFELISHWLDDLTAQNSLYGWILRFYRQQQGTDPDLPARLAEEVAAASRLSEETIAEVRRRAAAVSAEVRGEFELRYLAWTRTWEQPAIAASSAPGDRAKSDEFRTLLGLGMPILPLLVERLLDDSQSLALQAVQKLADPAVAFYPDPDDPAVLGGEQHRAREIIRRWLRAER